MLSDEQYGKMHGRLEWLVKRLAVLTCPPRTAEDRREEDACRDELANIRVALAAGEPWPRETK